MLHLLLLTWSHDPANVVNLASETRHSCQNTLDDLWGVVVNCFIFLLSLVDAIWGWFTSDEIVTVLPALSPVVLTVSATIAFFMYQSQKKAAVKASRQAAQLARERATLDLIEKTESTNWYQNLHNTFRQRRINGSFSELHSREIGSINKDRQAVFHYLNHQELVALGISEELLDEQFYKKWMKSSFVVDWVAASSFIQRERYKWDEEERKYKYQVGLFAQFNHLANKWNPEEAPILVEREEDRPSPPHDDGPIELGDQLHRGMDVDDIEVGEDGKSQEGVKPHRGEGGVEPDDPD